MSIDDPARPVTDEDRRRAVSELRRAAEDGRLSATELDDRLAQVEQARLYGQVRSALGGLGETSTSWPAPNSPAHQPTRPPPAPVQQPTLPQLPSPAGYRPEDRLVVSAGMSAEKRTGPWTIPPYVRLQAGFAAVKLDCRQATTETDVVDIEIGVGASGVVVIVPEGWGVNTDRLNKGIGTIKVAVPRQAQPGCPTLMFHGQVGVGSVKVRGANWLERKFDRG